MRTIARMLVAGVFVQGGAMALRDPASRAPKAARLGLPEPEVLVRVNAATMIAGGIALALGIAPRATATVLVGSLVPTTLAGHRFWEEESAAVRAQQLTQFMKNLAALGGLLAIVADPQHGRRRRARAASLAQTPGENVGPISSSTSADASANASRRSRRFVAP